MPFGLRTFKTGVSVFICILISFIFNRETYVVSALTAIFTIRKEFETSLRFGRHRIMGNSLGALSSLAVIALFKHFGNAEVAQLTLLPLVIMLMITLLVRLGSPEGTIGACATLFTILFMIPETHTYSYALNRIIDSFIGVFVGLSVDFILPKKQ